MKLKIHRSELLKLRSLFGAHRFGIVGVRSLLIARSFVLSVLARGS